MMHSRAITILFFLPKTFCSPLFCQGPIDSDSLVNEIRWTAKSIDRDTALECFYTGLLSTKSNAGFLAFYAKNDSVCKVVCLDQDTIGTKMRTYYYSNSAPIFISVKHNNFKLSHDIKQYSEAVLSFTEEADAKHVSNKVVYEIYSRACYYINQRKVFHSTMSSSNAKRLNKRRDKDYTILLVFDAEYILGFFQSWSNSFIRINGG